MTLLRKDFVVSVSGRHSPGFELSQIFRQNSRQISVALAGFSSANPATGLHLPMDTDQLLESVSQGDSSAAALLLDRHKDRLRNMVRLRLDNRLSARVDPSDIVQDALLEAHQRIRAYAKDRKIPSSPLK